MAENASIGLRPQITQNVTRGTARFLRQAGFVVLGEMPLGNGQRVDLMALSATGQLLAIEVKSGLDDFRVDQKWGGYRDYCDMFAFAVSPEFPEGLIPESSGLILADGYGGQWMRQPELHVLVPARRKMLTIQFGRLAASRLHALNDPILV